jgi:NIMA (never in mitosis gene a)-related kinase 1/4/5
MTLYRIGKSIGKGSFGEVFIVKNPITSNKYAMKRIGTYNMNTKNKRNLLNELRILRYSNCPYILGFVEVKCSLTDIEIITTLASYGDFLRIIKLRRNIKFEEQLIWSYFIQVSLGLKYLHNNNIIHRDIKCGNIFLDRGERVYIGDFGSSKIIKQNQKLDCTTGVGTPYYMCPQIVSRQDYSTDADVWGLGCFLFEIITFQPPFKAYSYYSLKQKIKNQEYSTNIEHYRTYYSKELLKLVRKIMKKDNRFDIQHILALPEVDEKKYLIPYSSQESQNIRSFEIKFRDLVFYNWYEIIKTMNNKNIY